MLGVIDKLQDLTLHIPKDTDGIVRFTARAWIGAVALAFLQSTAIASLTDAFPDAVGSGVCRGSPLWQWGHLGRVRVLRGGSHGMRMVGERRSVVKNVELTAVGHLGVLGKRTVICALVCR